MHLRYLQASRFERLGIRICSFFIQFPWSTMTPSMPTQAPSHRHPSETSTASDLINRVRAYDSNTALRTYCADDTREPRTVAQSIHPQPEKRPALTLPASCGFHLYGDAQTAGADGAGHCAVQCHNDFFGVQTEAAQGPQVTVRLTREEVIAKYAPVPHGIWAPEEIDAILVALPIRRSPHTAELSPEKEMLVREFARETLQAKRMSSSYVEALSALLGRFADADISGADYIPSRRRGPGTEKTRRNLLLQLEVAGLMKRQTKTQGLGFVGEVFVYSPVSPRTQGLSLEEDYRMHEMREAVQRTPLPTNLMSNDLPY